MQNQGYASLYTSRQNQGDASLYTSRQNQGYASLYTSRQNQGDASLYTSRQNQGVHPYTLFSFFCFGPTTGECHILFEVANKSITTVYELLMRFINYAYFSDGGGIVCMYVGWWWGDCMYICGVMVGGLYVCMWGDGGGIVCMYILIYASL